MEKENRKELSENTEKQQVNTGKQEDSEAKKSGLNRFFEEIFYLIFLLLIAVPFLIIAVGYFLGKAIVYIIIFPCFMFHAAFVAFQLFLDYINTKKADAIVNFYKSMEKGNGGKVWERTM